MCRRRDDGIMVSERLGAGLIVDGARSASVIRDVLTPAAIGTGCMHKMGLHPLMCVVGRGNGYNDEAMLLARGLPWYVAWVCSWRI
jgi:hypothetical protein